MIKLYLHVFAVIFVCTSNHLFCADQAPLPGRPGRHLNAFEVQVIESLNTITNFIWERRLEKIRRKAYNDAFAAGFKEGFTKALKESFFPITGITAIAGIAMYINIRYMSPDRQLDALLAQNKLDPKKVRCLLELGASAEGALCKAIKQNNDSAVELLSLYGDANKADKRGKTPLSEAIWHNKPSYVAMLVANNGNPRAKTKLNNVAEVTHKNLAIIRSKELKDQKDIESNNQIQKCLREW